MNNPTFPAHGTQPARALSFLLTGNRLNPLEAWQRLGIYKVARPVFDLRALGWPVQTEHINVGNRFGEVCHVAEYSLPPDAIAAAGDAGRQFVEDEREAMRNRLRRAA